MSRAVPASEGVAPSLLETPWSPRAEDRVGFYGCRASGGRVVRVGLLGQPQRKPPRAVVVDCPACQQSHLINPSWRRPLDVDDDRAPELVISADAPSIEEVA